MQPKQMATMSLGREQRTLLGLPFSFARLERLELHLHHLLPAPPPLGLANYEANQSSMRVN